MVNPAGLCTVAHGFCQETLLFQEDAKEEMTTWGSTTCIHCLIVAVLYVGTKTEQYQ